MTFTFYLDKKVVNCGIIIVNVILDDLKFVELFIINTFL